MADGAQAVGFSFRCDLCEDEHIGVPIIVNSKHAYVVDEECATGMVIPLIERSLASEYSYPPKWGNVIINYNHFLHLLPAGFREEFRQKRVEYRTPLPQRIYCRAQREKVPGEPSEECGAFLGRKSSKPAQHRMGGAKVKSCPVCKDLSYGSCTFCGELLAPDDLALIAGPFTRRANHRCPAAPVNNDEAAFKGLVLGVDYQKCPGCQLTVQLAEACNHLTCLGHACRTQFCAICGKPATHDSDHWVAGKPCPRWNKPTDMNAVYDETSEEEIEVGVPGGQEARLHAERLLQNERVQWRYRTANHELVRDESYMVRLLEMLARNQPESAEELPADLSNLGVLFPYRLGIMMLQRLLSLVRDAPREISLYRSIGMRLTGEQLLDLRNRYSTYLRRINMASEPIPQEFFFRFPRLIALLQLTADKLTWLIEDIGRRLLERAEPADIRHEIDPAHVPVVEDDLRFEFLDAHFELERLRLSLITSGLARPAGLGATIDMMWLMYSNLMIPKMLLDATSSRKMFDLIHRFQTQDEELDMCRQHVLSTLRPKDGCPMRFWEKFVRQRVELWTRLSESYDDAAEKFNNLVPRALVDYHRREWYD